MFQKLLIAGEDLAGARVLKTAQRLGIATVSLCSGSTPSLASDEALRTGPLDRDLPARAAQLAKRAGADAVHPGAAGPCAHEWAQAAAANGLVFVGAAPGVLSRLADGGASLALLRARGVPVVSPSDPAGRTIEAALARTKAGNTISLGLRDVSAERLGIIEAPVNLDPELSVAVGMLAVSAIEHSGVTGLASVRLRLDPLRIEQVIPGLTPAWSATEATTGLDAVELGLRLAAGEEQPLGDETPPQFGHAMTAIVVSTLQHDAPPVLKFAEGAARIERAPMGGAVPPCTPIAAVSVLGEDRADALSRLKRAMSGVDALGTNLTEISAALVHPRFASASAQATDLDLAGTPCAEALALGALAALRLPQHGAAENWDTLFTMWGAKRSRVPSALMLGDERFEQSVEILERRRYRVHQGTAVTELTLAQDTLEGWVEIGGVLRPLSLKRAGSALALRYRGCEHCFEIPSHQAYASHSKIAPSNSR